MTRDELKEKLLRHMPAYKSDLDLGYVWKRSVDDAVHDAFGCYPDDMAATREEYAEQRAVQKFREMIGKS